MTDEEMKRLEDLANRNATFPVYAKEIIALIERVRNAEAAADSAVGDMSADLRDAEHRGYEMAKEELAEHFTGLAADASAKASKAKPEDAQAWVWTRVTFENCASKAKNWRRWADTP